MPDRAHVVRVLIAAVAALALAGAVAWLVLTDAHPDEGPWVSISATHGIHVGDVMLVSVWALITAAMVRWAFGGRSRRPRSAEEAARPDPDRAP